MANAAIVRKTNSSQSRSEEIDEYKNKGSKLEIIVATLDEITAIERSNTHPPRNTA